MHDIPIFRSEHNANGTVGTFISGMFPWWKNWKNIVDGLKFNSMGCDNGASKFSSAGHGF